MLARPRALTGRLGGLGSDSLVTSLSSLVATGGAAIASILIARELGPAGRGDWAVIVSIATITATVAPLGLPVAIAYGLAGSEGTERQRIVTAGAQAALAAAMVAAVVATGICAVTRSGELGAGVIVLCGAIAAATVLHNAGQQVVLTGASLRSYVAAQVSPVLAMLLAITLLAVLTELTLLQVAAVSATSTALAAAVAAAALHRHRALVALRLRHARASRVLRPYLGYAVMTFGTVAMTQVVHRIDLLIVDAYRGASEAGYYAVAVQLGDVLLVVPAAVGAVLFRRGATGADQHYADALRAVAATAAFALVTAAAIGLAARPVIEALYGGSYLPGVDALRWLLPGIVLLGVQAVVSNYVASRGRPRAVFVAWVTAATFTITADLIVVPEYGIEGAAIVSSLAYLLVLGLHVPALRALRPPA